MLKSFILILEFIGEEPIHAGDKRGRAVHDVLGHVLENLRDGHLLQLNQLGLYTASAMHFHIVLNPAVEQCQYRT